MNRHAEIELLMLPVDPDACAHYAALALAMGAEQGRTCRMCGNQFARTRAESPAHWRRRKFCGRSCAGSHAAMKQAADKRASRIEDVEWLLGTDAPDNIAHRLGYADLDVLLDLLRRWDRADLATRLIRERNRVAA